MNSENDDNQNPEPDSSSSQPIDPDPDLDPPATDEYLHHETRSKKILPPREHQEK